MPAVSRQQQLRRLRLGIEPEGLFPPGVQQELNRLLEVAQTLLLGLALTIRAGNFQARRPKTALVWFAPVNNGCELFRVPIYNPSCCGRKMFLSSRWRLWMAMSEGRCRRVLRPGQFERVRAKPQVRTGVLPVPQLAVMEFEIEPSTRATSPPARATPGWRFGGGLCEWCCQKSGRPGDDARGRSWRSDRISRARRFSEFRWADPPERGGWPP